MAREIGYCWCPSCKKWVHENLMNYYTEGDKVTRVCTPCLEGTSDENDFVYEPHHEDTKCIYCDSYDTTELSPRWRWFKCNNCGVEFRRM